MNRRSLYIVILLAFISLSGIVILQIYWVNKAYSFEERQFNHNVVSTITKVVERILDLNEDSSVVEPVKQESNNFFVANVNDTLYPYLLESLLREEFAKSNLKVNFEYGIYNCFNDSIVFGNRVNFEDTLLNPTFKTDLSITNTFDKDGHYFGILFPDKDNLLIKNMDFWIFSSIIILLVVMFFSYSIMAMLRQKRLSEVKTDFINNMTHELKTPISTITLSSEVLLDPKIIENPQRLHQYAQIIQTENARLKNQVDKVLQVATLTSDQIKLKWRELDVHEIIRDALLAFNVKTEGDVFEVVLNAQDHIIKGDMVHISNIFHNILDNACKYTKNKPKISIKTYNQANDIKIEISDNGVGIGKKELRMIFDKFYRVPTGNQHDVKGFGLGLYYVKTVLNAHNGSIKVRSTLGQGSTFIITLNTIKK